MNFILLQLSEWLMYIFDWCYEWLKNVMKHFLSGFLIKNISNFHVCYCSRRGHFTVVPVLVGSLSSDKEKLYGSIFSQYLADPANFFVISSDFCHWGQRFRYTFYDKSCGDIWQSIEALDKMVNQLLILFCFWKLLLKKIVE